MTRITDNIEKIGTHQATRTEAELSACAALALEEEAAVCRDIAKQIRDGIHPMTTDKGAAERAMEAIEDACRWLECIGGKARAFSALAMARQHITTLAEERDAMKENRDRIAAALVVMFAAWDAKTTKDALSYIGLGHDVHFPFMDPPINTTEAAREVYESIRVRAAHQKAGA